MRGFRLTPLIVGIIGIILCIAAGCLLYFLLLSPTNAELSTQEGRVTADADYEPPLDQAAIKQAKDALLKAQQQAAVTRAQWDKVQTYDNPNIDVSDRFNAWKQWTNELEFDFAPRLQSFLSHSGVTPLTQVTANAPPADPNAVPTSLIALPVGTVQVFGSYPQILNHAAAWNRFDRIVMIDKLQLNGYSPFITGSYQATEYIFPRNAESPGPPVPSPTGGASAVAPGTNVKPGSGAASTSTTTAPGPGMPPGAMPGISPAGPRGVPVPPGGPPGFPALPPGARARIR